MSSRVSPFASLTGEEKQIRWLEYQSVTLPYVQGSVEPIPPGEEQPPASKAREQKAYAAPEPPPAYPKQALKDPPQEPQNKPKPPTPSPADFQKTRHSQYDAVIARMKQAEKGVRSYQALS